MGTTDDGGNGGLHNSLGALLVGRRSDAADTVARGTRHPSLASHTDVSDRHLTVVSWSMVGGLEIGLALRASTPTLCGWSCGQLKADLGPAKGTQAEDIFLTPRAWRVGIVMVLTNCTYTRARGSWWLIKACSRALILRTIGVARPATPEVCP
jgi:hypothetical protein